MGADAHSGAALRDLSSQMQQTLAACQTDGMGVHPGAGQNVFAAGEPGGGCAAGVGEDGLGRAGAEHPPAVHDDHVPAQAVGLVPVVGDEEGCALKACQQAPHLALHLLPEVAVQCAERLVQHQDAGPAHEDAGQRGALLLSAGKLGGAAVCQLFQPHGPQHFGAAGFAGGFVFFCVQAAEDVLLHGHIREKGVVLEQQAHAPLLGRQVDVLLTVEQHPAIQQDAALVGLHDARDAAQGHALAAAGCTQNGRGGVPGGEVRTEGKAVQLFLDVHFQTHGRPPAFCFFSSRLTASSTTAEMTMSTSTHRMAPSSSLVRQSW